MTSRGIIIFALSFINLNFTLDHEKILAVGSSRKHVVFQCMHK